MKRIRFGAAVAVSLLVLRSASATDDLWINTGIWDYTVAPPPQIDALAVYNSGTMAISAFLPYDFENTLNFTNRGLMSSSVGLKFDRASTTEGRRPAANFVNQRGGTIEAFNNNATWTFVISNQFIQPSFLEVAATNIVNEGLLSVNNSGLLRVQGKTVNLARGGIMVGSVEPTGHILHTPTVTNYFGEAGVWDIYWGTSNQVIDTAQLVRPAGGGYYLVTSPQSVIADPVGAGTARFSSIGLPFFYTNVVGGQFIILTNSDGSTTGVFAPTNIVRQVVFVGIGDTNIEPRVRFYPSIYPTNFNRTAVVELRTRTTNEVTEGTEQSTIYFMDRLASETNIVLDFNLGIANPPPFFFRPNAYDVWRSAPREFTQGTPPNANFDRNYVYDFGYSNRFTTNFYAAYATYVDYMAVRPPDIAELGPTEQPGRVQIEADTLDLTRSRFRGQGLVSINTKHLVSSDKTIVDAPSLIYTLGSTNGLLTVQNLAKTQVDRFSGYLLAWSGVWTNQMALILSNWYIDPTIPTNVFQPITNAIDVDIHVLMLGSDFLATTQQVITYYLEAHATNVSLNDPLAVSRRLLIDADTFTLNNRLTLLTNDVRSWQSAAGPFLPNVALALTTNQLPDWRYTNAPHLKNFTNGPSGVLTVPSVAWYGSDGPRRYERFVNLGILNAFTHEIASDYYEDGGVINNTNSLIIRAGSAKLEGGRDLSGGDVHISAVDVKLRNHTIITGGGVYLTVTNSLADLGGGSSNRIVVNDGFHLLRRPPLGDLLGTAFETTAPKFAGVRHSWTGEDRGATRAGFKDNAAIGRLTLRVSPSSELIFGKPRDFWGQPLPGNYALYVDRLDLDTTLQADPESAITIEEGLTIYFASANVPVQNLDGKFEGRLRWVKDFAGPLSGVDVLLRDGRVIKANIALVDSKLIDSDGDGLANAFDDYPFDGVSLTDIQVSNKDPFTALVSWRAAPSTVYRVEYATNLVSPQWQPLALTTNDSTDSRVLSVTNLVVTTNVVGGSNVLTGLLPLGGTQRYYRVRYDP